MDTQPAAKRIKLETWKKRMQADSTALTHTSSIVPNVENHDGTNGELLQNHTDSSHLKPSASAHEAWLEAKAKSKAMQGKRVRNLASNRHERHVYEDIDGAHGQQSPLKKRSEPATLPARRHFDPLRNQKSSPIASASPSRSGVSLGFFKQFHKPRIENGKDTPHKDVRDEVTDNASASVGSFGSSTQLGPVPTIDELYKEPERRLKQTSPVRSGEAMEAASPRVQPRKTFEDEIKALAEAARQEAEEEGHTKIGVTPRRRALVSATNISTEKPFEKRKQLRKSTEPQVSGGVTRPKRKQSRHDGSNKSAEDEIVDKNAWKGDVQDFELGRASSPSPNVRPEHDIGNSLGGLRQLSKTPNTWTGSTFSCAQLAVIRDVVLAKLTGKRPTVSVHLEDELSKVSTLIKQTITAGESNSLLLIGARGSGKTTLIKEVIRSYSKQYANDFHVVRLNGFIHTDDKIALREIWRQLGREMELDDEESEAKNNADTLTTLLALLSHPTEQGREQNDEVTKSVIFILDEFELFATHPRQTLLYNLFDIAQSRKAPIAVLGLTTRIDVAESLEKRVKSRFSHRYIYLSLPKSFQAFQEACKATIAVHPEELTEEEKRKLGAFGFSIPPSKDTPKLRDHGALASWDSLIEHVLAQELMQAALRRLYYTTKSIPDFQASMLLPIATIPLDKPATSHDLVREILETSTASSLRAPDSNLTSLEALSTLQLALLICAARLTNIHNASVVPFPQAYKEYKALASKAKIQASASGVLAQGASGRVWSKGVAKGAWEDLIEFGLVIQDGNRGGRVDVGLEEIEMSGVDLGSWARWCREI